MRNLFILLCIIPVMAAAQQEPVVVKWYTLAEAQELVKTQPKKIMIDMYTSWCGWCKKMDKETFDHPTIAQYLNVLYYPVKLDAETRDTILFKGKKYSNNQTGQRPSHDLAIELLSGKMSYPSVVYLDENLNLLSVVPGYMTPRDIEPVLLYFGRNIYRASPYEEFNKHFSETYIDSSALKKFNSNLITFEQYASLNKSKPRPAIIYLQSDWCVECRMMEKTTFTDSVISSYISKNFYVVNFNVTTRDSIVFNNVTYRNNNTEHPFHDLAVTMLNGKMDFPVMVFADEKGMLISPVPGYFSPRNIEPLLHFFRDQEFLTNRWDEYVEKFKSSFKK